MTYYKTQLHLQNKPVSVDPRFTILYHYSVERDNFGNWKYFDIKANKSGLTELSDLKFLGLNKNIYYSSDGVCYVPDTYSYLIISSDDLDTLRENILKADPLIPVIQLNIKCDMKMVQTGGNLSALGIFGEQDRWEKYMTANAGYYSTQIAVTLTEVTDLLEHTYEIESKELSYPKLRTDFWKHGLAGIIDVQETIKPCYWYGKQHPFEFSFIAGNDSVVYKLFTNVLLLTNAVTPESIHYTIDADTYAFSDDKANMYIRLEATKAFYQLNGSDILYDHSAFNKDFKNKAKKITSKQYIELDNKGNYLRVPDVAVTDKYKATILPLYYSRLDTFNEIEDYYKRAIEHLNNTDYPNLAGGEVVYDTRLDHFSLTNHVKLRDIKKVGRARGNLEYHNGYYTILINPLNIYQKNETWDTVPPINLANAPVPEDMSPVNIRRVKNVWELLDKTGSESHTSQGKDTILDCNLGIINKILTKENGSLYQDIPNSEKYQSWTNSLVNFVPKDVYKFGYTLTGNIDFTNWSDINMNNKEVKLFDTHIKILIRYSGDKLVLVKAVNTIFDPRV